MEDTAQTIEFNIDNMDSARLSQLSDGPTGSIGDAMEESKREPDGMEERKEIQFEIQDHMFEIEQHEELENYTSVSPPVRDQEKQIKQMPDLAAKMPAFEDSPGKTEQPISLDVNTQAFTA